MATYRRLMEAEALLDPIRRRRGASREAIAGALEIAEPDGSGAQSEDEAYLAALARYVAALGGRLELRAVFGEETVLFALRGGGGDDEGRGEITGLRTESRQMA